MNTIFNTFVPILSAEDKRAGRQVMNTMIGYGGFQGSANNLSLQLQVGSTEYPMRPVTGYGEAYYRLLRSLGIAASQSHSLAITRDDFNGTSFVLATDLEKVSTVMSSGQNVQGIDIRCEGKNLSNGLGEANSGVDRCFFTCHYQVFLELRAGSVTLLT